MLRKSTEAHRLAAARYREKNRDRITEADRVYRSQRHVQERNREKNKLRQRKYREQAAWNLMGRRELVFDYHGLSILGLQEMRTPTFIFEYNGRREYEHWYTHKQIAESPKEPQR